MKSPDISQAVSIYYSKLEIGTTDIKNLFSCSKSTALKLKNEVFEEMAKRGKRCFVPHHVGTKIAFEVWGFDIVELEKMLRKIKQYETKEEK